MYDGYEIHISKILPFQNSRPYSYGRRASGSSRTLHSYRLQISITDEVEINEQNESIITETHYLQTEFQAITHAESYGGFKPCGVSDVVMLARSK